MEEKIKNKTPNRMSVAGSIIRSIMDTAKVILISLVIVIPIRHYVIQPFLVKGASMEPGFHDGEYLIVDELSYQFKDPERGEVIIFHYPRNTKEYFIKRVIGLPNERVEIKNREVIVYNNEYPRGKKITEGYLKDNEFTKGNLTLKLEEDEYFVLGDNRQASSDSRVWGAVKKDHIVGKAWVRAWPLPKATVFAYNESILQ